jgi:hypothetical protein
LQIDAAILTAPHSITASCRRRLALLCAALACAPLAAQDDASGVFEFGGTQRTRYENIDGQFRAGLDAADRALALQTSLTFDWRRAGLEVFGEVMDVRVALDDAGSYLSTSNVNTLEPVQAYVAWHRPSALAAGGGSTLRAGRMTLDVGKRRLVARSRFRNSVDSFAGLDWEWRGAAGQVARAFYLRPMEILPGDDAALLDDDFELDRAVRDSELFGAYYQPARFAHEAAVEIYAFEHRARAPDAPDAAADHLTLGSRYYRAAEPGRLNYELETVVQRGSSGGVVGGVARADLTHRAHFFHFEIGYQLTLPAEPNVVFQYDLASGDEDPSDARNDRFDTLFGDRSFEFGPTGLYGVFARANLRSPGLRVTFQPRPRFRCVLVYRRVELDEPRDAWVGSGYRDPSGASGSSLGRHLDASVSWAALDDRLQVDAGIARFAAGSFATRVAGAAFAGNPRYFYLGATTSF